MVLITNEYPSVALLLTDKPWTALNLEDFGNLWPDINSGWNNNEAKQKQLRKIL